MEFLSFLSLVSSREKEVVKNLFLIFAALVTERFSQDLSKEFECLLEMYKKNKITSLEIDLLSSCVLLHAYFVTRKITFLTQAKEFLDNKGELWKQIDPMISEENNNRNTEMAELGIEGYKIIAFDPNQAAAILLLKTLVRFETSLRTSWFVSIFMTKTKDIRKRNAIFFSDLLKLVSTDIKGRKHTSDGAIPILYHLTSFCLGSNHIKTLENMTTLWGSSIRFGGNPWARAHLQVTLGMDHRANLLEALADDYQRALFLRYPDTEKMRGIGRYWKINESDLDQYLSKNL